MARSKSEEQIWKVRDNKGYEVENPCVRTCEDEDGAAHSQPAKPQQLTLSEYIAEFSLEWRSSCAGRVRELHAVL